MIAENTTFIYALIDQRTNEVRYVGKADDPYRRLQNHLVEKGKNYRLHWIRLLLQQGHKPGLQILERCSKDVWAVRERDWIAFYRKIGFELTNATDGGDGVVGYVFTSEVCKKLSEAQRAKKTWVGRKHSVETRKKMSDARKGAKLSFETRQKMSAAGKKKTFSEECKRKISIALTGKHPTAETRSKMSLAKIGTAFHKGYTHSAETRKKMSAAWKNRSPTSSETRKKLSDALRRRWAMIKNQNNLVGDNHVCCSCEVSH